jgi:predicted DNA-binding transcriptional regulator YafY
MKSTMSVGRQVVGPDLSTMVCIDYVNHRGERALRRIIPQRVYFGVVTWHSGPQWILDAWDCDKAAVRSFALHDIQQWGV